MSENEIQYICQLVHKGGKLYIGRDHAGRQKIKIVRGPFGIFTERFNCTADDLHNVRKHLMGLNSTRATA